MKNNKFKLLILVITLFLVIPLNVFASDGETDKLYINIDIQQDGSIKVKELATLEGTYNGRLRNIYFANLSAPHFTGATSDFESSDIYNGSSLTDLKIYDVAGRNNISFKSLFDESLKSNLYIEGGYASDGNRGKYLLNSLSNGITLKIYNPSSSDSSFYMEYTVNDAVVVHNDVAELAWNILGKEYEDNINNMEVHINLPTTDNTMKVWLRGPLNGYIENIDNSYAKITYSFVGARNAVSARIMFDKNLVKQATKFSGVNGKENILAVEKIVADKANKEREKIKFQNNLLKTFTVIWYLVFVFVIILLDKKKRQCAKTDFDQDYLREFPAEYGPEIVSYLINNKINENSMSASILMLIEKKVLMVEQDANDKNNFILIKNENNTVELTNQETKLLDLIINEVGNGSKVTLKEIKNYGKNLSKAQTFIKEYDIWKRKAEIAAKNENFFLPNVGLQTIAIIVSIIGIFITIFNIILETNFILGFFTIVLGIVGLIISTSMKFRTPKGALHYKEWMALKHFMVDFGTMNEKELPEIALWGKYLVYATALGCAKELEETMKIRIENMNIDQTSANYYLYNSFIYNIYITSSLSSSVNNSIMGAVSSSRSSIASSYSSSSSGGGGGASFGGGSFGGGGGGGHF